MRCKPQNVQLIFRSVYERQEHRDRPVWPHSDYRALRTTKVAVTGRSDAIPYSTSLTHLHHFVAASSH